MILARGAAASSAPTISPTLPAMWAKSAPIVSGVTQFGTAPNPHCSRNTSVSFAPTSSVIGLVCGCFLRNASAASSWVPG